MVPTNIPANANRGYTAVQKVVTDPILVANVANNVGSFVDTGVDLGTLLPSITGSGYVATWTRGWSLMVARLSRALVRVYRRLDGLSIARRGNREKPVVFTSLNDIRYGAGGTFNTANRSTPLASDAGAGNWGGIYVGHTVS
ncbi:MAG: hypothetical protein R3C56_08570 [Pirellulaceae bacterium]